MRLFPVKSADVTAIRENEQLRHCTLLSFICPIKQSDILYNAYYTAPNGSA